MYGRQRNISPTTLIIFATLFIFSSFSLVCSFSRRHPHADNTWDVLIFTQNWPNSVCNKWMEEGKGHTCRMVPNNTWTIHGIWPTKLGTIGPGFCDSTRHFSPQDIYGIEDKLEKIWAPIEKHKKITMLWSHEWEKHGTCAAVLPQLSTEFLYFSKGLKWMDTYNMANVLPKAGIKPGREYNLTEIWDGLKNVLNKNPQVVCYKDKQNSSVLLELRICFDKNLTLTDCDGTVVGGYRKPGYHNLTDCDISKSVSYPGTSLYHLPPTPTVIKPQIKETLNLIKLVHWLTG